MCGPRRVQKVIAPDPTEKYSLMRPAEELSDAPIMEPEPYYQSYQYDPSVHQTANTLNEELMIKKKQAQGFS